MESSWAHGSHRCLRRLQLSVETSICPVNRNLSKLGKRALSSDAFVAFSLLVFGGFEADKCPSVYAQGLTLAVVIASLALEAQDRTQTPKVEPPSEKDQWKGEIDCFICLMGTISTNNR